MIWSQGTPPPQQLTILRPESKPGISDTYREVNHIKYPRPVIVTKSLTTLNQRLYRDSKNTTKGASGDKIDRTGMISLNLVSPKSLQLHISELAYLYLHTLGQTSGSYNVHWIHSDNVNFNLASHKFYTNIS